MTSQDPDVTALSDALNLVRRDDRRARRALFERAIHAFFEAEPSCQAIVWSHAPLSYNDETYFLPSGVRDACFLIDGAWEGDWRVAEALIEREHLGCDDYVDIRPFEGACAAILHIVDAMHRHIREWLGVDVDQRDSALVTVTREGIVLDYAHIY